MMSIRAVNSPVALYRLDHRPRPIPARWDGTVLITFGCLYFLTPASVGP